MEVVLNSMIILLGGGLLVFFLQGRKEYKKTKFENRRAFIGWTQVLRKLNRERNKIQREEITSDSFINNNNDLEYLDKISALYEDHLEEMNNLISKYPIDYHMFFVISKALSKIDGILDTISSVDRNVGQYEDGGASLTPVPFEVFETVNKEHKNYIDQYNHVRDFFIKSNIRSMK